MVQERNIFHFAQESIYLERLNENFRCCDITIKIIELVNMTIFQKTTPTLFSVL